MTLFVGFFLSSESSEIQGLSTSWNPEAASPESLLGSKSKVWGVGLKVWGLGYRVNFGQEADQFREGLRRRTHLSRNAGFRVCGFGFQGFRVIGFSGLFVMCGFRA